MRTNLRPFSILTTPHSPPNYEHCVTLLAEIKGQLLGVIERAPPTHPLRMLITETLDIELIQQEV